MMWEVILNAIFRSNQWVEFCEDGRESNSPKEQGKLRIGVAFSYLSDRKSWFFQKPYFRRREIENGNGTSSCDLAVGDDQGPSDEVLESHRSVADGLMSALWIETKQKMSYHSPLDWHVCTRIFECLSNELTWLISLHTLNYHQQPHPVDDYECVWEDLPGSQADCAGIARMRIPAGSPIHVRERPTYVGRYSRASTFNILFSTKQRPNKANIPHARVIHAGYVQDAV